MECASPRGGSAARRRGGGRWWGGGEGWGFDSYKLTPHFGDKAELCHFLGLSLHLSLHRTGNLTLAIRALRIHIHPRGHFSWSNPNPRGTFLGLYTVIQTPSIDVKYDSGTLNYTLLVAGQVDTLADNFLHQCMIFKGHPSLST